MSVRHAAMTRRVCWHPEQCVAPRLNLANQASPDWRCLSEGFALEATESIFSDLQYPGRVEWLPADTIAIGRATCSMLHQGYFRILFQGGQHGEIRSNCSNQWSPEDRDC